MANAMSIMHSTDTPPFITTWQYSASWWYQLRDSISWFLLGKIAPYVSARRTVNKWRQNNGLSTLPDGAPRTGGLIQVAQQPAFFEFPKSDKVLPQHFFYTSPWHNLGRDTAIPFPFEKLNPDKQLIYASLGTLQNKLLDVYKNICEACVGMENVQLVVALGNEDATIELEGKELPEECIVVGFVPQLQLLRKASLVITHCGMNTCLESLACGLPAIAIPVTNDQPGVAARWRSLGAATVIDSPKEATPDRIQKCITELLPRSSPSSQAAKKLQARLRSESPRLEETAELIEIALNAEFPLVRDDARAIKLLGNRLVEPIMQ
jgi:zeaxanthin glucosyltransferase